MPSASSRLDRLEHQTGGAHEAGPSLIVLTALGRSEHDIRGIQLARGRALERLEGESVAELWARAEGWVAALGSPLITLATAIYADEQNGEECQ